MSEALAPKAAEKREVDMSNATKTLADAAAKSRNIDQSDRSLSSSIAPVAFTPFNWTPAGGASMLSEDRATPHLMDHFWQQLTTALPPDSGTPFSMGLGATCKIVDARTADLSLQVTHKLKSGVLETATINGHPDAVITLFDTSDVDVKTSLRYACAIIDWKTPKALASSETKVRSQLLLETISFYSLAKRSVPVIATDCATSMRIWVLEGRKLVEYLGSARVGEHGRCSLTLEEGCGLLVHQLLPRAFSAAKCAWDAAATEQLVSDDDQSDGDDDVWGNDGPNSDGGDVAHLSSLPGGFGGSTDAPDGATGNPSSGGHGQSGGGHRRAALAPLSTNLGNARSLLGPIGQKRLQALIISSGMSTIDFALNARD